MIDDDLARELADIKTLARGHAPMPITEPKIVPGSFVWHKVQADERARLGRLAAAQAAELAARAERGRLAEEAAERRAKNAPALAKLRARAAELAAKRQPLTDEIQRLQRQILDLVE